MFDKQTIYMQTKYEGFVNFVQNKMHYWDTEYDFEMGKDKDVIRSAVGETIDLENYKTIIAIKPGIGIQL